MKNCHAHRLMSAAVLSAILSMPVSAVLGQQRVNDGRARDANTRVGSGGVNDQRLDPQQVTGNQIVTGNVTGGRQFRGNINYTDPFEFRGNVAGSNSDRFIRDSTGAPPPSAPSLDPNRPRAFYGEARLAERPPGYLYLPSAGGYVSARNIPNSPQAQDYRLDTSLTAPPLTPLESLRSQDLILQGPTTDQQDPTILSASPLYGVRQLRLGDLQDRSFLENYTQLTGPRDRFGLTDAELNMMRRELTAESEAQQQPGAEPGAQSPAALDPLRLGAPPESPKSQQLPGEQLPAGQIGAQTLGGSSDTQQGTRQRLLISPAQQSTQYAELKTRLDRFQADPSMNDQEAHRQFMRQQQILNEANEAGGAAAAPGKVGGAQSPQTPDRGLRQPGQTDPAAGAAPQKEGIPAYGGRNPEQQRNAPSGPAEEEQPGASTPAPTTPKTEPAKVEPEPAAKPAAPAAPKPDPVKIDSLAEGVKAEGLRNVLKNAEDLMLKGKYISALEQYEAAQQIAPNNPLVLLGQAHAELGAGYYARAENNLRKALSEDQALLMGQYDLRKFLGEDRVLFLANDLKDIANKDRTSAQPVLLLAYIAYNTGNEAHARDYLDMAEKRSDGRDPIYPMLRQYWKLPDQNAAPATPQPEMNK